MESDDKVNPIQNSIPTSDLAYPVDIQSEPEANFERPRERACGLGGASRFGYPSTAMIGLEGQYSIPYCHMDKTVDYIRVKTA
jgi:hypothetical protein